jgi:hypothetical protein
MSQPKLKTEEKRGRGRPKGSKTRKTLEVAISKFEAYQLDSAQLIVDIMMNNVEGEEVSLKERAGAAKYIITAPTVMRKGLQETSETVDKGVVNEDDDGFEIKPELAVVVPLIQVTMSPEAIAKEEEVRVIVEGKLNESTH